MCIHNSQSRIVAVRVSGSPLQSQYTTVFQHITIHWQQKCWITGSPKKAPPPPPPPLPLPCSNTAYWQIYLYVFLVSVCSSIYPGLHQNSSKVNSQGQASGRSFNRGSSIMAPASAQLTLTPAQEKEDNSSQEQAAKAEIKSTGNKIWQNCLPAKNILTFLFVLRKFNCLYFFIHITFWLWWVHSAEHSGLSFFWIQDRANSH